MATPSTLKEEQNMAVVHSASELIEDREIDKTESDRLAHNDIVEQLHTLVTSVPTPSNIALYGAWGSGKSGIGKMLEAKLSSDKTIKFARFDAFKYAQNPLRRNFISVVANAVGVKDNKYHRDLYSGLVNTDFKVPPAKLWHLLRMFGFIAVLCVVIVLSFVAAVTWFQGGDIIAAATAVLVSAIPTSLVPAALLTALLTLAGKTFTEERRADRAESDEEFENLFSDLVRASKASKLVIFVDELDRCAPDEVVETLDSVRTFFGVEKCVFIVASDPQVLEQALTSGSKQANPVDATNPYYSAGSAYLDKVFQYQVALPPLMPQSVTSYAIELVEERPGVWEAIDIPTVVSVLIPTHVRSPRRVKNLLNSFVLAYRLAEARQKSGLLEIDLANDVEELARVVCLRVEFPLFARDLATDPDLSTYVLELSELDGVNPDDYWSDRHPANEQTRRIAEDYAAGNRAVDRLLISGEDARQSDSTVREVQAAHGKQLLDYLSRTRMVDGPTKALIHLQNSGQLFGLPAALADDLEREAQNGSIPALRALAEELDGAMLASAVDLLTQLARTAPGYEGWNIARAVFVLLARGIPAGRASHLAAVIGPIVDKQPSVLADFNIIGAWNLALASKRAEARALGRHVLASNFAAGESMVAALIENAEQARAFGGARVSEILVERLLGEDPELVIQSLQEADAVNRLAALRAIDVDFRKQVVPLLETHAAWQAAEAARDALPAPTTAAARAAAAAAAASDDEELEEEEEPYDARALLSLLVGLAVAIKPSDPTSAELILSILLDIGRIESRDAIQESASELAGLAKSRRAVGGHLRELDIRHVTRWGNFIPILDASSVVAVAGAPDAVVKLVSMLGTKIVEWDKAGADGFARANATVFVGIVEKFSDETRARVSSAAAMLGEPVTSAKEITKHQRRVDVAMILADEGLCSPRNVLEAESDALAQTLETELEPEETSSPLADYAVQGIERVLTAASPGGGSQISVDAQSKLFAALASCDWMSDADAICAVAVAIALAAPEADRHGLTMPTAAEIKDTKSGLRADQYTWLVQNWLEGTDEELADIVTVVQPLMTIRPSEDVLTGVRVWRERAGTVERFGLVDQLIGLRGKVAATKPVFEALGLSKLPDAEAAAILLKRYKAATTNSQRLDVLPIWETADIRDSTVRSGLIADLLIPLFGSGVTAAEPALGHLKKLASPVPSNVKKPLGEAVLNALATRNSEKRAVKILEELGYKYKRNFLGVRKSVDMAA